MWSDHRKNALATESPQECASSAIFLGSPSSLTFVATIASILALSLVKNPSRFSRAGTDSLQSYVSAARLVASYPRRASSSMRRAQTP
mgnify:FL=1